MAYLVVQYVNNRGGQRPEVVSRRVHFAFSVKSVK